MSSRFTFKAIGTAWVIDIADNVDDENKILSAVMGRIDEFDKTYSRFREDSLVTEMSKKAGEYTLPDDAIEMFNLYRKLYDVTGGLVTPLIGKTLIDAGYDPKYSLRPKEYIAPARNWDDVIKYTYPKLILNEPTFLDFGAIGKGYLVDIVSAVLEDHGVRNYTVDAGGDIKYRSEKGKVLKVGLENPKNTTQVLGITNLVNRSICGSAGNRRTWGKYTHIINPLTTESPKNILAVWAVADQTMVADGLTTALFFINPDLLKKYFDFEFAIVYADHSARISPLFPGHFFTQ